MDDQVDGRTALEELSAAQTGQEAGACSALTDIRDQKLVLRQMYIMESRSDRTRTASRTSRLPHRREPHPLEGVPGAGRGEVLAAALPGDVRAQRYGPADHDPCTAPVSVLPAQPFPQKTASIVEWRGGGSETSADSPPQEPMPVPSARRTPKPRPVWNSAGSEYCLSTSTGAGSSRPSTSRGSPPGSCARCPGSTSGASPPTPVPRRLPGGRGCSTAATGGPPPSTPRAARAPPTARTRWARCRHSTCDLINKEAAKLQRLYDDHRISDTTRRRLQRSLDLEEARLSDL